MKLDLSSLSRAKQTTSAYFDTKVSLSQSDRTEQCSLNCTTVHFWKSNDIPVKTSHHYWHPSLFLKVGQTLISCVLMRTSRHGQSYYYDCPCLSCWSCHLGYVHTVSFSLAFYIVLRPQGIRKQMKTLRKRHRVHIALNPDHNTPRPIKKGFHARRG